MKITVKKLTADEIDKKGIKSWPIWSKEVSTFDWEYSQEEECLILEGKVEVECPGGQRVEFGKGDFVVFPKGLSCVWEVKEPVRKHYNFK